MSVRLTIALTGAAMCGYLAAAGARPAPMPLALRGWAIAAPAPDDAPDWGELPEWYLFRHALDACLDSMDQEP